MQQNLVEVAKNVQESKEVNIVQKIINTVSNMVPLLCPKKVWNLILMSEKVDEQLFKESLLRKKTKMI